MATPEEHRRRAQQAQKVKELEDRAAKETEEAKKVEEQARAERRRLEHPASPWPF